jgi:hypothetical protein
MNVFGSILSRVEEKLVEQKVGQNNIPRQKCLKDKKEIRIIYETCSS